GLLVAMHHSGLFDRWRRHIATGVSWYHNCQGGEFVYYPNGRDRPPRLLPVRRNTAIVLDTDSVFHGIAPLANAPPTPPGGSETRPYGGAEVTTLPRIEPGVRLHRDDNRHWSVRRDGEVRAVYDWDDL